MTTFETATAAAFWLCLACVVYANVGYPLAVWLMARRFGRPTSPPRWREDELPTVSLLIAAYNEESVIEERVKNALALDYPAGRLEVVVASDGSSDGTNAIVRRYADRGVRLLDYAQRRGKSSVLNSAFAELKGDIVLLSDANTNTDPDAVRKIVRWFRDPTVGVVCGRLVLTDPHTGGNVDSLYWKYETFLKRCESRLGALLGANGGIYAIRHQLFTPIPTGTLVDDFVIPLLAKMRSGCAIVFDGDAVAREETPADLQCEFHRRARIGAGGFQSFRLVGQLLNPKHGWVAFTFLSHKVLRWVGPFCLLGMLLANMSLRELPFYRLLLAGQLGFYLASMVAAFVPARLKVLRPLRLAWMFTMMNSALFMGFFRWLRGGQKGVWRRTERTVQAQGVLQ